MKIAVAMSGGVDSSAAAAILKEEGHELVEWHRLHDAGSARASTGWRLRKSFQWMKRRSGRSGSCISMGVMAVRA